MAIYSTTSELQKEQLPTEVVLASQTGIIVGTDAGRAAPGTLAAPRRADSKEWVLPGNVGNLLLPADVPLPPARRLVVLVPDGNVDESGLAACIWSLASPRGLEVLLLGTLRRPQEQFRARRRLVAIGAITRDDTVHVDIELLLDQGWQQAVRRVWRPGDLIVCHSELMVAAGLGRRPLSQALLHSLAAPVYVVSGFYPDLPDERVSGLVRLGAWIPPVAIVLAFLGLQMRLTEATTGTLQTVMLIFTVLVEFILIAAWERFLDNLQ